MIKNTFYMLSICYLLPFLVLADQAIEKQLLNSINQQLEQSQKLLVESVNINSGTQNFAGVKQVGMLLKQQYDALGFQTKWVDGSEFGRAGHLLATFKATRQPASPKILMIGHLDTVFAKQDSFQQARIISENAIAGPGITDMKGGNVIMLAALQALHQHGLLSQMNIKVVLTGDEEASGRPLSLSKKALIDAGIWADIALGFEDGDGDINTAVTARRGSVGWTLNTSGNAAHSSKIFTDAVGYGAIFEMARILNSFREQLSDIALLSFNPGLMAGGTRLSDTGASTIEGFGKTNVVAQVATVKGGLRAASPAQLRDTQQKMQQIVSQHLPLTNATLVFDDGYPPMQQTDANLALLAIYNQISLDLGYNQISPVNPRNAGAADISFVAKHVDMAMDGLGLMGTGGHTKDEVADMSSFAKNIHKTAVLLLRLSQSTAK